MLRILSVFIAAGAASLMITGVAHATDVFDSSIPPKLSQAGSYEPSSPNASVPQARQDQATPSTRAAQTSGEKPTKIVFRHPKTGELIQVTRAPAVNSDFVGTSNSQPRSNAGSRLHP
jgi:hypothetical protein